MFNVEILLLFPHNAAICNRTKQIMYNTINYSEIDSLPWAYGQISSCGSNNGLWPFFIFVSPHSQHGSTYPTTIPPPPPPPPPSVFNVEILLLIPQNAAICNRTKQIMYNTINYSEIDSLPWAYGQISSCGSNSGLWPFFIFVSPHSQHGSTYPTTIPPPPPPPSPVISHTSVSGDEEWSMS